jgi:aerobic carbon-monoxide dehydrogenase small subunit
MADERAATPSPGVSEPAGGDLSVSYGLRINDRDHAVQAGWLGESLLYVLRERLGLPGAKNACEQGECGSCSVLLDGVLVCACCVLAADAVDGDIRTVEGFGDTLTDLQQAFIDQGGVQCGFCTPGLIVTLHDLLDREPDAGELAVREAISGNLCRCTGYGRIFAAVAAVQQQRGSSGGEGERERAGGWGSDG